MSRISFLGFRNRLRENRKTDTDAGSIMATGRFINWRYLCTEMYALVWCWRGPVSRRSGGSAGGTPRMSHCYRPWPSHVPFIVVFQRSRQNWITSIPFLLLCRVSYYFLMHWIIPLVWCCSLLFHCLALHASFLWIHFWLFCGQKFTLLMRSTSVLWRSWFGEKRCIWVVEGHSKRFTLGYHFMWSNSGKKMKLVVVVVAIAVLVVVVTFAAA